jgi:hypothetical protein
MEQSKGQIYHLRKILITSRGLSKKILNSPKLIQSNRKEILNLTRSMTENNLQTQKNLAEIKRIALSPSLEEQKTVQEMEQVWKEVEKLAGIIMQHQVPWDIDLLSEILQSWKSLKNINQRMIHFPSWARNQACQRQIWVEDAMRKCLDQVRMEVYEDEEEETTALLQAGMLELSLQRMIEEIERQREILNQA